MFAADLDDEQWEAITNRPTRLRQPDLDRRLRAR
jgi:hypothetical protein